MRKYLAVLSVSLKNALSYRAELVIYFLGDFSAPLLMIIVWSAVFTTKTQVAGFTRETMLGYYLFVFIFRTLLSVYPHEIGSNIKRGLLNQYLLRPFSLIAYQILGELAWKIARIFYLLFAVTFLFVFYLHGWVIPAVNILNPLLLISIIFAFLLNFYIKTSIEFLAFWFVEISGIRMSFYVLESLLSGLVLPLSLLPFWLSAIAQLLPFRFFYYFPAQILLGQLTGAEVVYGVIAESAWLLFFFFTTRLIFSAGLKHYSAVSG